MSVKVCLKHKPIIEHYVERLMKFVAEHLAQGEIDKKATVN
jgi:hypothetical protein